MSARVRAVLRLYDDDLHVRFTERTAKSYMGHVMFFLAWLHERDLGVFSVRTTDIHAHQGALLTQRKPDGKPYSVGFQQNRLSSLKSLYGFLFKRGYMLTDPSAIVDMPRSVRKLPTILTSQEVQKIIDAAKGKSPRELRDRAMLETLYSTGIRVSELAELLPYDVDTEERCAKIRLGKGQRDRMVPLTHAAARAIESYLSFGRPHLEDKKRVPYLFLSNWGFKCRSSNVNDIVHRYAEKTKVKKRVTCHTFRHSIATHLLKGRASIRHIQALLGHRSLQSTERYLHLELSDLREVIARAHPRGR